MKRYVLLLAFFVSILTLTTAFTTKKDVKEINPAAMSIQSGWGPWKTASCFNYLQYRVKKKSYENEWAIEFKNGYNESMSMSIGIVDGYGGDRFTIPSGKSSVRSGYYTNNKKATYINFEVDKVKFDDTGWGGPYAECDH